MPSDDRWYQCSDCKRIWIHTSSNCNTFYYPYGVETKNWWLTTDTPPFGVSVTLASCMSVMEDPPQCQAVIKFYNDRDISEGHEPRLKNLVR